jgi:uncharacterized membrane protein
MKFLGDWGFSYVGLVYLLMLFIPNMIWTKKKPKRYDEVSAKENKLLQIFERIGQMSICCFMLIFSDFNVKSFSLWTIWLAVSFLLLILYEICWLRYFKSQRTMKDFYRSFAGIPIPLAVLPVAAFFLLGIYGKIGILIIAIFIFGIGHIGIHAMNKVVLNGAK